MTHPSPPSASAPIAWVRAAFLGALAGGLLWAIVWKLFAVFGADTATALRIVGPIAIVWVPVALLGAVAYRFSASPRRRTYLTAAVIALCTGVLLPVMWGFLSVNALTGSARTNGAGDGPPIDRPPSRSSVPPPTRCN